MQGFLVDEAVTYMESEILNMCFDIALVSCGGYGLPLSIRLKKRNKKVIQWGGCYQLWFGILGGRWSDDVEILKFKNRFWTYPSEKETPPLQMKSTNHVIRIESKNVKYSFSS